jgi:hypothetical protein
MAAGVMVALPVADTCANCRCRSAPGMGGKLPFAFPAATVFGGLDAESGAKPTEFVMIANWLPGAYLELYE